MEPHISQFPFSHTVLRAREAVPGSSWLQCEHASDRAALLAQVAAVHDRYPGVFPPARRVRPHRRPHPAAGQGITPLIGLPDHEGALQELIGFCRDLGMTVLNPHSHVVEEGGFVGDTGQVVDLERSCDPHGLLNPGKLGDSFSTSRGLTPPSARAATARR